MHTHTMIEIDIKITLTAYAYFSHFSTKDNLHIFPPCVVIRKNIQTSADLQGKVRYI